jgi:hypothetical protein
MERVIKSIVASILLCIGTAGAEEGPPAASPVNRIPNGSFEVGSAGWMLVETQIAGTRWGLSEEEAPHGRQALYIDQREAAGFTRRSRLQGPWFEHGETALLVSAMVRADEPCEIAVGLTHGEITGWDGPDPLSARETFDIGPEWRRVVLRVPRRLNRPREQYGERNPLARTVHTKSMVYLELNEPRKIWIDAVQAHEADSEEADPPPFAPASPVELGWSVEHGGIFHDRPRFEAVVANHGDARWSGQLHSRIRDYRDRAVQLGTEPVAVAPGESVTVKITLQDDALGFFKAALSLVDARHREVATEHLTMARTEEGPGSDFIALTANASFADNRVNTIRSAERLGFTQVRTYHMCNWQQCVPREGEWVSPAPLFEKYFGKSGIRTMVNFQNPPKWVIGPDGTTFAYPLQHLDAYREYVRRAVSEIEPWLSSSAFINEPNAHFHGGDRTYLAYQNAMFETVREAAPGVTLCGLQPGTGAHAAYVEKMLKLGGRNLVESMDVLAVQTHPFAYMPIEKNGWDRLQADLREVAAEYGIERIWTTEMGFETLAPEEDHMPIRTTRMTLLTDLAHTERTQADRLTRAALYGLASTFERFYAFHFGPCSPYNGILYQWSYSRNNHLVTPRPALAALAVANRMIAGTDRRAVRAFATPGLWGATFMGDGRRVDALWSVAGPQHVRVTAPEGVRVHDLMGNRVSLPDDGAGLLELGESPVYLVGDDPGRDPVAETLSVAWELDSVWSGGPFRGEIGLADAGLSLSALRLRHGETGRELWSAEAPQDGGTSFAFDLDDVPGGPLPLAIEGVMEDGRVFVRRLEPMVMGDQAGRRAFESGEPLVVEEFDAVEVDGTEARTDRGLHVKAEVLFPWFDIRGHHIARALAAQDSSVRVTIEQPVGKQARGKPDWPALEVRMDEPLNWLAYRALRIRYRWDCRGDGGTLMPDPRSAAGISLRLGTADGSSFFASGGSSGPSVASDGDWYVATLPFDRVAGLNEKRAGINYLQIWPNGPADDENPFGFSIDRIDVVPALESAGEAAVQEGINYAE